MHGSCPLHSPNIDTNFVCLRSFHEVIDTICVGVYISIVIVGVFRTKIKTLFWALKLNTSAKI